MDTDNSSEYGGGGKWVHMEEVMGDNGDRKK